MRTEYIFGYAMLLFWTIILGRALAVLIVGIIKFVREKKSLEINDREW